MTDLFEILEKNAFFSPLTKGQREKLLERAELKRFSPEIRLLNEKEPAVDFYLIVEGDVALMAYVPQRGEVVLQTLHSGAVVGWSWLFPPYEWHYSARTNTRVTAIVFDGAAVRSACEADHEFGYQLMRLFANMMLQRLQMTRMQLLDVYGSVV